MKLLIILSLLYCINAQTKLNKQTDEIVAEWYPIESNSKSPTLIVIGGSEGGFQYGKKWSKPLNDIGINVLALAYFAVEGLPKELELIPIEYFETAIDWLRKQKQVDQNRIGLMGISKGSEIALYLASQNKAIHLVIAVVPSSVIWQSVNRSNYSSYHSTLSNNGKELEFTPYDFSGGFTSVYNLYAGALKKSIKPSTIIPVEQIQGSILLLSSSDDNIWPSNLMSKQIVERLKQKEFQYEIKHLNFPNGGHSFHVPEVKTDAKAKQKLNSMLKFMGGTIDGFYDAQKKAKDATLSFLKKHFKL